MTLRLGILGYPLGHSISPAMHGAALAAAGLQGTCEALSTPPEDFPAALAHCLAEGWHGFSVTVPHKETLLRLPQVGWLSPEVEAIGAANTLVLDAEAGFYRAYNTDWQGFAEDLFAHGIKAQGRTCLILGTGGSAKAAVYALRQQQAAEVICVSRAGHGENIITYADLPTVLPQAGLIVNCTPVGMYPNVEANPWPADVSYPPGVPCYDLIYNPPVTPLLAQAEVAGAQAISGLGMLIRQGAVAFELWTGRPAPLNVMSNAARAALGF